MYSFHAFATQASTETNHILYYVGVTAIVLAGVIIAASAFIAIYMNIKNSKAELSDQNSTDGSAANGISHDEADVKEVEEK